MALLNVNARISSIRSRLICQRALFSIKNYSTFPDRPTAGSDLHRLDLQFPARSYPEARRFKREVHLHIGPTNSGKSYTALLALKAAKTGYFAGPLRMLAREVYDRMNKEGVPCNLVTGDEILEHPGARLSACTVEMINLNVDMEVAVIDEIQMLTDPDRGSVWTQAFLGVRCKYLHVCGDPNSEDIVSKLVKETGDTLIIHRYNRLNKLEVETLPLKVASKRERLDAKRLNKMIREEASAGVTNEAISEWQPYRGPKDYKHRDGTVAWLHHIRPGDAIVAFTKKTVQSIRDKIVAAYGNQPTCAIIYGSLPPDIRAEQSRLFNEEDSGIKYLVASDAVGMGLNLSIKRIVFTSMRKFDGVKERSLEIGEIKQIAGRAGRFRSQTGQTGEPGKVACVNMTDIPLLQRALAVSTPKPETAYLKTPRHTLTPTSYDARRGKFSSFLRDWYQGAGPGDNYELTRVSNLIKTAEVYDTLHGLTFSERALLLDAPFSNEPVQKRAFYLICRVISTSRVVTAQTLFPEAIDSLGRNNLKSYELENIHKILSLYMWFTYRFPCNFSDRQGAWEMRKVCEERLNLLLRSSKSLAGYESKLSRPASTKTRKGKRRGRDVYRRV